ncbi:MAG: 2TM domain-containing protein [Acidimicrobiia bacterium]|nr:2TM domain-containing protein [Acidimicrobiia bacterium]
MTEEQRQRAIGLIQAKREFWRHFAVYLVVNAFLVLIWALTSGGYFWPVWPILGWGIGVAAHAVRVYVRPAEISEAQIDRELDRLGS